jgi:hypothetical protein
MLVLVMLPCQLPSQRAVLTSAWCWDEVVMVGC